MPDPIASSSFSPDLSCNLDVQLTAGVDVLNANAHLGHQERCFAMSLGPFTLGECDEL